jgi:hypothetical protein
VTTRTDVGAGGRCLSRREIFTRRGELVASAAWQLSASRRACGARDMALVALVVAVALLRVLGFQWRVGKGRNRFNVPGPATTGPETWERYNAASSGEVSGRNEPSSER